MVDILVEQSAYGLISPSQSHDEDIESSADMHSVGTFRFSVFSATLEKVREHSG
jgi:hypothetical protein